MRFSRGFWGALVLFLSSGVSYATTPWEVAVVILGRSEMRADYQKEADRNVLELGYSLKGSYYRMSLHRELPQRAVTYFPDPHSQEKHALNTLLSSALSTEIPIYGHLEEKKDSIPFFSDESDAEIFFKRAFTNPSANRMLVIFAHGFAFQGLQEATLRQIKRKLTKFLPPRLGKNPLDILWFDACFMGNLEVAYDLAPVTTFVVGSEESEFSSGAAFEQFSLLSDGPDSPESVALELAEGFLDSYSYAKKGAQRASVLRSSATLSVVDTRRLKPLVERLARFAAAVKPFDPGEMASLRRSLKRIDLKMEDKRFVMDLGSFFLYLENRSRPLKSETARDEVRGLTRFLELNRDHIRKATPRLRLQPPSEHQRLIFGYNDWEAGHLADQKTYSQIPENLRPTEQEEYFRRPGNRDLRRWPSRMIEKRLYVTPFGPHLTRFHYFFTAADDPSKQLTPEAVFERTDQDVITFLAQTPENPVRFTGYTQGVGKTGEKYTGLTLLDFTYGQIPSDYLFTEFSKVTRWEELAD